MTEKLLEKRVGVSAGDLPKLVTCSWPLGSVTMYSDRLVVNAGVELYELAYEGIDHLQINPIQVHIEHHALMSSETSQSTGSWLRDECARRSNGTAYRSPLLITDCAPNPLTVALASSCWKGNTPDDRSRQTHGGRAAGRQRAASTGPETQVFPGIWG